MNEIITTLKYFLLLYHLDNNRNEEKQNSTVHTKSIQHDMTAHEEHVLLPL